MKKIGEKLSAYFKERGITQEQLAEELGVSQAYINALFRDKKSFGKRQAKKWHDRFGFSTIWLLTGSGDMFQDSITQNNQNGDNINGQHVTINKTEKDYLDIIKAQSEQFNKSQEQISKSQEQIDRLLTIIEKMQ